MNALNKVIQIVGSQERLASLLNIKQQNISVWLTKGIPAKRVLEVERLTGGKVTRYELKPDLYPRD